MLCGRYVKSRVFPMNSFGLGPGGYGSCGFTVPGSRRHKPTSQADNAKTKGVVINPQSRGGPPISLS